MKEYFFNHHFDLFLFIASSISIFYLIPELSWSIPISLTILSFNIVSSYYLFKRIRKLTIMHATYTFFYTFLSLIEIGESPLISFQKASKYLSSYQSFPSYNEEKNNPSLNLFSFQNYYDYILKKDLKNEAHLLHYRSLINEVETKMLFLDSLSKHINKMKKSFILFYTLILLLSSIFSFLLPNETLSFPLPLLIFFISLILPLSFLILERRILHEIKSKG